MSKQKKTPHHPYAKLFEYVFQKKELVEEFAEHFFPKPLFKNLDISSLEPQNVSYLSPELGRLYSDVVYTCNYGEKKEKVLVTLLFEHKSYYSKYPHLQLLGYMLKIWEQQRDNSEEVTPVIPIILYHGDEQWNERKFSDMFAGKIGADLKPYVPEFDLHLVDLSKESDEKLKSLRRRFLTNSLLTFKYHKNASYIRQHFSFLVEVGNDIYQEVMLVFLIKNYDISKPEVTKLLENTPDQPKSKIMNAIEAYYSEGEAKGLEKGKHNNNVRAIKKMVEKGSPMPFIIDVLSVTEDFIKGVIEGTIGEME